MNSFTLTQAAAIDEAVRDKASHDGSAYLGGGTNLVDLLRGPDVTCTAIEPGAVEVTGTTAQVIGEAAAAAGMWSSPLSLRFGCPSNA